MAQIMRGGAKPTIRKVKTGAELVTQGEAGMELSLFSRDVIVRIESMMAALEPLTLKPPAPVERASANLTV